MRSGVDWREGGGKRVKRVTGGHLLTSACCWRQLRGTGADITPGKRKESKAEKATETLAENR